MDIDSLAKVFALGFKTNIDEYSQLFYLENLDSSLLIKNA